MTTRVLYPVPERNGTDALPLLSSLARPSGSVVYVLDAEDESRAADISERLLAEGVDAEVAMLQRASLADSVRHFCRSRDIDVAVSIGSSEDSVVDRVFAETTQDLIEDSGANLLVATRAQSMCGQPFSDVLVPVDFSEASRSSLEAACYWAAPGATVHLLYVVPEGFPLFHGARGLDSDYYDWPTLNSRWQGRPAGALVEGGPFGSRGQAGSRRRRMARRAGPLRRRKGLRPDRRRRE